jgi:ATP synthase protein I
MKDLTEPLLRAVFRTSAVIAAMGLLSWALFPAYRVYTAGFLLGMVFSAINTWYLIMKAKQIAEIAEKGGGRRTSLGFIVRAAICVAAVAIAVKKPQFDVAAAIIGLFSVNLISVVVGMYVLARNHIRDHVKGVKK